MPDKSETLPPRPGGESCEEQAALLETTRPFRDDSSIPGGMSPDKLADGKRAGDAVELPPDSPDDTTLGPSSATGKSSAGLGGRRFGDYELLAEIARGGMGVVYKARQTSLDRIVALKMILAGHFASEADVERFYTEARAAAHLRHPHIVAIHEVGRHDGQHYFSMDYVDGKSLAQLARESPMSAAKAAGYVKTIADAIEFAHQRGILHRDLKPANVLVDASDTPRVTDFGLAKRIDSSTELTASGSVMGTPSYMPPEQAGAFDGKARPASDVYSLGAILYELVTRRPPFLGETLLVTLNMVLNTEPVSPRLLNPTVTRDLETICLKCLQKEPHKRYATANDLSEDLGRFLNHEPVLARPVGGIERAWRWCRRNQLVASLIAATATALMAGTAISTGFAIRAGREADQARTDRNKARIAQFSAEEQKQRAERNEKEARAAEVRANKETQRARLEKSNATEVSQFLASIFQTSDPLGIRGAGLGSAGEKGAEITAGELLRRGRLRIESDKGLLPLVKGTLMAEIGNVLRSLGRYDDAEPLLRQALDIRRKHRADPDNPTDPADLASSLFHVGWLEHDRGNYAQAEQLFREALSIQRRQTPQDVLRLAEIEFNLAWTLADHDRSGEAVDLFSKVARLRQEKLGKQDRRTVIAQIGLIGALLSAGRDREALAVGMEGLDPHDVAGVILIYTQARFQRGQKHYPAAARSYKTILEIVRKHAPSDHPALALLLGDYAGLLAEMGDYVAARNAARESLEIATHSLGEHPKMAEPLRIAGRELIGWGAFDEAERLLERAWQLCNRRAVHEKEYQKEFILRQMVRLHREAGDYEQAETWARRGADFAAEHWQRGAGPRELSADLCAVLCERGKLDEACTRLRADLDRIREIGSPAERFARQSELRDCLRAAGRYEEAWTVDREARALFEESWKRGDFFFSESPFRSAEEYARAHEKLLAEGRHAEPFRSDPDPLRFIGTRLEPCGQALLKAGRFADAERTFKEALDKLKSVYPQEHISECSTLAGLAAAVAGQGRHPEAESFLRQALSLTRKSYGDASVKVADAQIDLAACLFRKGDRDGGLQMARDAQRTAEEALAPGHAWLPAVYQRIAPLFEAGGRGEEAEGLLERAWTFDRGRFPVNHPRLTDSALLYARVLLRRHRLAEAEGMLRGLGDRFRKELPAKSWRIAVVGVALGAVLSAERKFEESERLLTAAHATLARGFDPADPRVLEGRQELARLYEARGKPEKASLLR